MKRILTGIIAVTLMMLCSCTDKPENGPVPDQQIEITTAEPAGNGGAVPGSTAKVITEGTAAGTTTAGTAENGFWIPNEGSIGVWSTDVLKTNQILIYEITEGYVKVNTGVSGLFGVDVTAMLLDGEYVFGDGVSPGYDGPEGIKGRIKFSQDSITVTYDSFGSLEDSEYYSDRYTFTIKDENSYAIVSEYKATLTN